MNNIHHQRTIRLWIACLCAGLFCLLSLRMQAQEFRSTGFPDRVTLTWSADPATTQTVTWRTDSFAGAAKAQVKQEDASPNMEQGMQEFVASSQPFVGTEGHEDRYHRVTFTELQPATLYAYRVGNGEQWSEWFQFRTAQPVSNTESFSFIYLGDGQNDLKSRWSRAIRQAFRQQPDARFMIHTGDLINRANTDAEWGEWHYGSGFIHATIPAVPTPGNHEYLKDASDRPVLDPHWAMQFGLPENGPEGMRESVYYLDYQNVRVISLNTQLIMLDELPDRPSCNGWRRYWTITRNAGRS